MNNPSVVYKGWERDVGPLVDDQWEKAWQSVPHGSLNVSQRLMQLTYSWKLTLPLPGYKLVF